MKFCPYCGNPVETGWSHCGECGKAIPSISKPKNEAAEHSLPRVIDESTNNSSRVYVRGYKTKGTAVLLALLFGAWSWLYTYKQDAAKFWAAFIITGIVGGIYGFMYGQAVGSLSVKGMNNAIAYLPVVYIVSGIIWLIAVVDAASKDFDVINGLKTSHAVSEGPSEFDFSEGESQMDSNLSVDGAKDTKVCPSCKAINRSGLRYCRLCFFNDSATTERYLK